MSALPIQVVMVLDVDDAVAEEEIIKLLPPSRYSIELLRLSECGAPKTSRLGAERAPVDWDGLAQAVVQLVEKGRGVVARAGRPVDFYVVGKAPLPIFVHLGLTLSAWAGSQSLINRRKDGVWDVLPLTTTVASTRERPFFDRLVGLEGDPRQASGRVAVFISLGQTTTPEAIRGFVTEQGDDVAGVVEITPSSSAVLDAASTSAVADELTRHVADVRRLYPYSKGIALFVAGPASLAFMAGRAVNPNVIPDTLVADFTAGRYQLALALPWAGATPRPIGTDAADELERATVLKHLLSGFNELRRTVTADHLPPFMTPAQKDKFLGVVRTLEVNDEPEGEAFELRLLRNRASVGRGLLEALRPELKSGRLPQIGQLIFLHEIYHEPQNVRSSNYRDIGRAGVALEEIDFWADAVALGTAASWDVLRGGEKARAQTAAITSSHILAAIKGMEAFDRSEQGPKLTRLYERRMRRYLIWHLQRVRAETLSAPEDIWTLFSDRLVFEVAPLVGHLDNRFDKVVRSAAPNTEAFVVLGRALIRQPRHASFDPGALVEAVRTFDDAALHAAMDFLVNDHATILAGWKKAAS
ncbi:MAG: SAVED domain-containing protein [Planctomycetota bacterium]|nr:SAVED domain-containing protein [Planctomycetota bacterium]